MTQSQSRSSKPLYVTSGLWYKRMHWDYRNPSIATDSDRSYPCVVPFRSTHSSLTILLDAMTPFLYDRCELLDRLFICLESHGAFVLFDQ